MEMREITCIQCPMGCALMVTVDGENISVSGNGCPRGAVYGEKEVTSPMRTVTSTVVVEGGAMPRVSVKTAGGVPKGKIFDVMEEIHSTRVAPPVKIGDILIKNVANTGVDLVATSDVK